MLIVLLLLLYVVSSDTVLKHEHITYLYCRHVIFGTQGYVDQCSLVVTWFGIGEESTYVAVNRSSNSTALMFIFSIQVKWVQPCMWSAAVNCPHFSLHMSVCWITQTSLEFLIENLPLFFADGLGSRVVKTRMRFRLLLYFYSLELIALTCSV